MSTQTKPRTFLGNFLSDGYKIKQFVVYASSETVSMDGTPLQEIPLFLIEDSDDRSVLARAMVDASNEFPACDGWIIEYRDAETVPDEDFIKLCVRLNTQAENEWAEFIDLPDGTCSACGGTGYVTMCICAHDGTQFEMHGDCDACDSSGESPLEMGWSN